MRTLLLIIAALIFSTAVVAEERAASYVDEGGSLYVMKHGRCTYKHYNMPGFHDAYKVGQEINRTYCWRYNGRGEFFITNFAGLSFKGDVEDLVYEDDENFELDVIKAPSKRQYAPPLVEDSEAAPDDVSDDSAAVVSPIQLDPRPQSSAFDERVRQGHDAKAEWVDSQGRTHHRFVLH